MINRSRKRDARLGMAALVIWIGLAASILIPLLIAAQSPLLEWRDPVYIVAGFAGIVAMTILLMQPLFAGGYLAGVRGSGGRRIHRWMGGGLLFTVVLHVAGLWLTSPPDVIDALLFRSPTPFSVWGVIAMWALFATALLAALRQRLKLGRSLWRLLHALLATVVVMGTVIHALQIEGTMGNMSKTLLCLLVIGTTGWTIFDLRSWHYLRRRR
ncbi:MAG: ferric reductase-like transmembrane domain-containing protein [Granulosicoccus sp.]